MFRNYETDKLQLELVDDLEKFIADREVCYQRLGYSYDHTRGIVFGSLVSFLNQYASIEEDPQSLGNHLAKLVAHIEENYNAKGTVVDFEETQSIKNSMEKE